MIRCAIISLILLSSSPDTLEVTHVKDTVRMHVADTLAKPLPFLLPQNLFISDARLFGAEPWTYAPIPKPEFPVLKVYGFDGSIGFGEYSIQHPDKFYSTLEGYNFIDIPELFLSEQMMIGNTLKLGKNIYFLSGILYGSQLGVRGNNWGMGTREGLIWHPSAIVTVLLWTQYFQSVSVYTPVMMPGESAGSAALMMPATPEVFSFGVQASFTVGGFIIGIGTSIAPVPFQDRHHSEFRYR